MARYLISSVSFDDDGVISVTYMDKQEALRKDGAVFRSQTVSVGPEASALYGLLSDIKNDLLDFLVDVEALYKTSPPFIPNEDDTPDDDDEPGMGF
jgi:hypothetical protein